MPDDRAEKRREQNWTATAATATKSTSLQPEEGNNRREKHRATVHAYNDAFHEWNPIHKLRSLQQSN